MSINAPLYRIDFGLNTRSTNVAGRRYPYFRLMQWRYNSEGSNFGEYVIVFAIDFSAFKGKRFIFGAQ